ncbi:substrate-binding domain-containing protein [Microbacterium oleivorans]|uniref:Substrate-binding domain-containing protein n=1 Tax=Microbacterium oleivorans TaxID=273677 RepID=A0A7D5K050_9MICO|nr:substrate-binding domain-containing protein [Microbacterium oleivorans]QLD12763.1 substrate-binding domain-containing protein [Microbacterium oleivorans]
MKRSVAIVAAGAALVLGLAGCSGTGQDSSGSAEKPADDIKIAVVTHSPAGDPFWDKVKSGAEQAGTDLSIAVSYQGDNDPVKQSQFIASAIADGVDGLVVSMANPDGVRDAIEDATAAGIPVVTINAGADRFAEFGAITHVGQDATTAAQQSGERLVEAGKKSALCVVQEAGNTYLETTCKVLAETAGLESTTLQVDGTNLADVQSTISSSLQANPSVDVVVTINSDIGQAATQAVEQTGSSAVVTTYNPNADTIQAIIDGKILFAVDQQGFSQGYVGVSTVALAARYGNLLGGGQAVSTGPTFIDADNADTVEKWITEGTR